MVEAQMTNLDIQCAELGRRLVDIRGMDEKTVNALMNVLEEQGPYAMFLYLRARHNQVAGPVTEQALDFLRKPVIFGHKVGETNDVFEAIQRLAKDLDDLLFVRDLLRTALSYARYHLKAKGGETS